jgi:hypothetical protein
MGAIPQRSNLDRPLILFQMRGVVFPVAACCFMHRVGVSGARRWPFDQTGGIRGFPVDPDRANLPACRFLF